MMNFKVTTTSYSQLKNSVTTRKRIVIQLHKQYEYNEMKMEITIRNVE